MADYEAADLTKEELVYLDLRRKLKDHYRKQLREESTTSPQTLAGAAPAERKDDDFGSFFGPSQPTIIPSVIKNTTSLLQFAVVRMSNLKKPKVVDRTPTPAEKIVKPSPAMPKVDPVKVKLQKMKEARDYSFLLSDDAPVPRPKSPLRKKASAPKPNQTSALKIPKKDRPVLKENKPVSLSEKNPVTSGHKIGDGDAGLEKKRPISKVIDKASRTSLQDRPKKRPLPTLNTEDYTDGFDYRNEIRNMFGYDPNKYHDDGDTRNMEAGFHDILKEERRSALIAMKEDQIEQKRIEEEERKERMKKSAKKLKLSQS